MVRCPKCGSEIGRLVCRSLERVYSDLLIDGRGEPYYEPSEEEPVVIGEEFLCPVCFEKLFDSEGDAVRFLKGEPGWGGFSR